MTRALTGSGDRVYHSKYVFGRHPAAVITFNTLLVEAGFDPADVLLLRHTPVERELQKVLPWIAAERRDLFKVYHQTQWPRVEQAMLKARYLASFLALESGEAVFAGIYEIGANRPIDHAGYWAAPGQRELVQLGMTGKAPDAPDSLWFELEEHGAYAPWIGKLVVTWPAMRSWWRWAGNARLDLHAVTQESLFVKGMPDWEDIVLTWEQLSVLPASWRAALAEWRGVYFIFDEQRRAGYVGSAYGADKSCHVKRPTLQGAVAVPQRWTSPHGLSRATFGEPGGSLGAAA